MELIDAYDFDLQGLVGIRLIGAGPSDLAAVRAQLGPIEGTLTREPDIVIRFVERLPLDSPLRLIGEREAGFTEDAFLVLRGKHKTPAVVELPLEKIGGRLEIRCERGLTAVPLLIAILNLTALARGGLPLHASAFRYQGRGVLAPGWAKGGKTELLLAFAAEGAEYVGDEWVYLDRGGDRISGIPEPIRIWDSHLVDLPTFRRRLRARQRVRLACLRHSARWMTRAAGDARSGGWRRGMRRLARVVESQRYVHLPPGDVFGAELGPMTSRLDTVVFVASHDGPDTVAEAVSAEEVAERMTASLQEERSDLMSCYRQFRFAFPGRRNRLLDTVEEIERQRLHDFLRGRTSYAVHHPYPPSLPALFEAVRPLLAGDAADGSDATGRSDASSGNGARSRVQARDRPEPSPSTKSTVQSRALAAGGTEPELESHAVPDGARWKLKGGSADS